MQDQVLTLKIILRNNVKVQLELKDLKLFRQSLKRIIGMAKEELSIRELYLSMRQLMATTSALIKHVAEEQLKKGASISS